MSKRKDPKNPNEVAPTVSPLSRRDFLKIAGVAAGAAAASQIPGNALAAAANKLAPPIITCGESTTNTIEVHVCAGADGAKAGFSLQWMSCAEYAEHPRNPDGTGGIVRNSWYASDDPRLCKASFSGNANGSNYNLNAGQCIDLVIGGLNDADPGVSFTCNEPLDCDDPTTTADEGCYVFHAFAHNVPQGKNKSDFTANLFCSTDDCELTECTTCYENGDFCTKSQGYYGGAGAGGLATLVACFGGSGGTGDTPVTANAGPLLEIGNPALFSYEWHLTQTYTDLNNAPSQYNWIDDGLIALRKAIGGQGTSGAFSADGSNTIDMGTGGGLASQTAALALNVALSGSACSGFPAGYGTAVLCNFAEGDTLGNDGTKTISAATATALNGQTVSQVLAAANLYLGGSVAVPYGLTDASWLNDLVADLNLAFDGKDWDGDTVDDHDCGGMSSFAENHLRTSCS